MMKYIGTLLANGVLLVLVACSNGTQDHVELSSDHSQDRQAEIHEAIMSIKKDIESANISGLQAMHLKSEKFTKFGPRNFERQDVESANETEAAFFSSIASASYEVQDLKIDVFGDVGIATYYPQVSFVRRGEEVEVSGRQSLVFLKTKAGWKIVHEHGTIRSQ